MNLGLIGTGYVGLVTGTCFAEVGNNVVCVDTNKDKINMLKNNNIPIYEPGLEELVKRNSKERLSFSTEIKKAVSQSSIIFIAVGTPSDEDGSADVKYVISVAHEIARQMQEYKIIAVKSTVPVGICEKVRQEVQSVLDEREVELEFDIVYNPEFLKEGDGVDDFMKPDRIIIGTDNVRVEHMMKMLYEPFNRSNDRVKTMSIESAEMTKYAANVMLATKISLMNELAQIAETVGADISDVRKGIGSDSRIGYKYIYPGVGFGGSCLPKDLRALIRTANEKNISVDILKAVEKVNNHQTTILTQKVIKHFGKYLSDKTFAIWGLSFKPGTDDMREAPSISIIETLLDTGASLQVYDPISMKECQLHFGKHPKIHYAKNRYDACKQADALLLVTEWLEFRTADFEQVKQLLKTPVIFDGRNQYHPKQLRKMGYTYHSIGRP